MSKTAICPRCNKTTTKYEGWEYKGYSKVHRFYCDNCGKYFFVEEP